MSIINLQMAGVGVSRQGTATAFQIPAKAFQAKRPFYQLLKLREMAVRNPRSNEIPVAEDDCTKAGR